MRTIVSDKLASKWSPEQVAGWLKQTYPESAAMHISHETLYTLGHKQKAVYTVAWCFKKRADPGVADITGDASIQAFNTKGNARGGVIDAVSIHDRPEEVNDRMIPGHWEGDLICGIQKSYIATLVELTSQYTLLVKLTGNDTQSVVSPIAKKVIKICWILPTLTLVLALIFRMLNPALKLSLNTSFNWRIVILLADIPFPQITEKIGWFKKQCVRFDPG